MYMFVYLGICSQCTMPAEDVEAAYAEQMIYNNFLLLQYLVAMFEKDYQVHVFRYVLCLNTFNYFVVLH